MSAHVIENDLYALTGAPWKQNFRGGAAAQVVYGGKTSTMQGELIRDPAVVSDLYLRCAQSYGVKSAQRMIGLKFREQRIPTLEEFREAVDRMHLTAVRLTPRRSGRHRPLDLPRVHVAGRSNPADRGANRFRSVACLPRWAVVTRHPRPAG